MMGARKASGDRAYARTEVPVAKSQEELRALLLRYGAEQFTFGEGRDWVGLEFVHDDQLVRLRCPMKLPTEETIRAVRARSHSSMPAAAAAAGEQEAKRVWRVLVWSVKARLVAVDEGLETFEQAFLPHLVDPGTGRTVWEAVREPLEAGALQVGGPGLFGGPRAIGPATREASS